MLALALRLWPYLAGAALIIGAALYLHHAGYESGYAASEAKWQPLFAAAERAREVANAKARQQEADSSALTQRVEAEHNRPSHLSTSVLLMLSIATLASCATAPPVPVVAQCPKMAEPPPSLMQPAQAANSSIELGEILQRWLAGANQTLLP